MSTSSTCYWSDRKRIFTMPISTTSYALTDAYLRITTGLLGQDYINILLHSIRSVKCRRALSQRFVNQGDIVISWMDDSRQTSVIENIKDPIQVTDLILDLSESAKRSRYFRRDPDRRLPSPYIEHDDLDDTDWD